MEVVYNGRIVDSDNFRVVVHHESGISRVAEGWGDYQNLLKTGVWFDRLSDVPKFPAISNKRKRKTKAVNDDNGS